MRNKRKRSTHARQIDRGPILVHTGGFNYEGERYEQFQKISRQEIREAKKQGIDIDDLVNLYSDSATGPDYWQSDC